MSVSLYYSAHRDTPLSGNERTLLTQITDAGFEALFAGSGKLTRSHTGEEPLMAQMRHYLAALGRLREAFPDAEWRVHIDDVDVPWVDGRYVLEGVD